MSGTRISLFATSKDSPWIATDVTPFRVYILEARAPRIWGLSSSTTSTSSARAGS